MNPVVENRTEALAKALAESEEYRNLQTAREEMEKHEAAKIMLRDLQVKQEELQQKQLSGQLTENDVQRFEQLSQTAAFNPYVRKLLEAEYAFSQMWIEVQETLGKAVGLELPSSEQDVGNDDSDDQQGTSGSSKLWTPR